MAPSLLQKASVAAPLAYALYVTVTCPCDTLMSCHKLAFFGSVGLAAGLTIVYLNRLV